MIEIAPSIEYELLGEKNVFIQKSPKVVALGNLANLNFGWFSGPFPNKTTMTERGTF